MWHAVSAFVLAGCGRLAFDPRGDAHLVDSTSAPGAIPCSGPILEDAFADDTIEGAVWFHNASTESGGRLAISPTTLNTYQGLFSLASYDFRGRWLGVAFADVPATGTSGAVGVRTKVGSEQDFSYVEVRDQMLRGGVDTPNTTSPLFAIPYDPAAHRIVRMRVASNQLIWELSADATVWNEVTRTSSPPLLRDATLWVYAYDVAAPLDTIGRVEHVVICPN